MDGTMKGFRKNLAGAATAFLDAVLPPRCVVTGNMVDRQGMIAPEAWRGLDFIADPFCAVCGVPFDFEIEQGGMCASCLQRRPSFATARAALKYNDGSRSLILGFKHGDKTHAVHAFVPWLARAGAGMLGDADALIPVPLHRWRLLARRYNQAALMAFALSKHTGVACLPDGLKRVRATVSQGHMKADERHKNVKHAFAVPVKMRGRIEGKKVVLIDDVYTTGATVKECVKALQKAGAGEVHVLTLARVVRGGVL